METVEFLILRNLLYNEEYVRKVIPFIKADYFEDRNQKIVFEEIIKFVEDYNKPATKEILCIEAEKRQDITDDSFKEITNLIKEIANAEVSPSQIILKDDLNKIGVFKVDINFHSEVKAYISIKIDKIQSK